MHRLDPTIMSGDEVWRVSELIDESQPFIQDVKLARQIIETLKSLKGLEDEHSVRIPKATREFADNTLSNSQLKWKAKKTLEEALSSAWNWEKKS